MRVYVVRDSSGVLYVVRTDIPGPDAVYIQYAMDVLGKRDAWRTGVLPENVDIDVLEIPSAPYTHKIDFGY